MRVLLIEDSMHLRTYVSKALRRVGFATDTAADGEEGLYLASTEPYDVVILDLMLPKVDGLTILSELRGKGNKVHILILTARNQIGDRVTGFRMGADDYLVKPFAIEELIARVQALVRRQYKRKSDSIMVGKGLKIEMSARKVTLHGERIELRPREYNLLEYLAVRRGQVVSREEIENHVYDEAKEVRSNTIDSAVCVLRRHLHRKGSETYLHTVYRQGYKIEEILA